METWEPIWPGGQAWMSSPEWVARLYWNCLPLQRSTSRPVRGPSSAPMQSLLLIGECLGTAFVCRCTRRWLRVLMLGCADVYKSRMCGQARVHTSRASAAGDGLGWNQLPPTPVTQMELGGGSHRPVPGASAARSPSRAACLPATRGDLTQPRKEQRGRGREGADSSTWPLAQLLTHSRQGTETQRGAVMRPRPHSQEPRPA
ncbi:uncharacterized protein [Macaca nemestrina]|uniref:uncharacterized protein isoform X2 n=1 Tax=Macaca nemestrina TaxID=9545 RepID=UPI0039B97061